MKQIIKHIILNSLIFLFCMLWAQFSGATPMIKKVKYNYLLQIPEGYEKQPDKKWPVIFYLHGRHASGKNSQSIKRYGLPYFISKGKKMDFIVVSPQCPWGKNWATEDWFSPLYEEISAKLNIDESRLYMIGISMGGFGTWALANRMPDRFAAIAPFCGGADVRWADSLQKIPTWVFHGTADRDIPISRSEVMVKALEKRKAEVRFTRLKGEGHDISRHFNNDELYAWLLQHSLKKTLFWEEPLPFLKSIAATSVSIKIPLQPIGVQTSR